MTIDLQLCKCMLDEVGFKSVRDSIIDDWMLFDDGAKVYKHLMDFYRKYNSLPSEQALFELSRIPLNVEVTEPIEYYIDRVIHRAKINFVGEELKSVIKAIDDDDPEKAMEMLKAKSISYGKTFSWQDGSVVDINQTKWVRRGKYDRMKELAGEIDGVATPWSSFNRYTLGLHPGDLMTLVARPMTGKSFLLCYMFSHCVKNGLTPLLMSMEMSVTHIARRVDALTLRLPYNALKEGRLEPHVEKNYYEYLDKEDDAQAFIADSKAAKSVDDIELLVNDIQPDIVFVDGIYLLKGPARKSKWEQMGEITRALKLMAQDKKIPVVATSQFSRKQGKTKDSGSLENIGYSDSIPQDSDVVLAMFAPDKAKNKRQRTCEIMKNREGELTKFKINWDFEIMNFTEMDEAEGTGGDIDFKNNHVDF